MKKKIVSLAFMALAFAGFSSRASAQRGSSYENAVGLFVDAGNGGTYVGPHLKHYFDDNNAGQAMLLFGNGQTVVGAEYSYNVPIAGADGLRWNLGVGPQVVFGHGTADAVIRPMAGLECKIPQVPVVLGFDWRPAWQLTHGNTFEAGRFGVAFKFAF